MSGSAVNRLKSFCEDIISDKKTLIKVLLIVMILLIAVILRIHEDSKADITVTEDAASAQTELIIDIGGAVVSPGVYKVTENTRLYEVIELAGGLTSDADAESINQAAFVEDGEKIIIPVRRAYQPEQPEDAAAEESGADTVGGTEEQSASQEQSVSSYPALININTATKAELMTLSGIGEVMASRIIEYRTGSRFRKIEDIKSVKGIGEATYNKLKDNITV